MAKQFKNILINRIHDQQLLSFSKKYFSGKLLDIGCGTKPYQELLSPYIDNHIGVDHEATFHDKSNIDLFGSAYQIPAERNSFDSVLCSAVLEHLEEPEQAIRECYRILKPGGFAIYSVPFIWHTHEEPRDFFRYTKYGLTYLFNKTGFEIIELKALSGFWVTFGQLLTYNLYRLNWGLLRWLKVIDMLGLLLQLSAFILDKLDKTDKWTWMYMVVVKKTIIEMKK